MLISTAPLRVSFCGGGSDIASFYNQHEGVVLSSTIDQFVYVIINPYFDKTKYHLKYSKTELVSSIDEIEHPIIRECLKFLNIGPGIEICSLADIHSGTGLGSSSSFTVALLNGLHHYKGEGRPLRWLAEMACRIEIDTLGEPIGKQDQYAAATGGALNFFRFKKGGGVDIEPVNIEALLPLQDRLLMFYTGDQRDTRKILQGVSDSFGQLDKFDNMREMVNLTYEMRRQLKLGSFVIFGQLLDAAWRLKKKMSYRISNPRIDFLYEEAMQAGALGGKLLGAGGSGFLLFYVPRMVSENVRSVMTGHGLQELPFKFNHGIPKVTKISG